MDKSEFVEQEKLTRNLIRNAKRRFEKKLADGNGGNKRLFFAYVKQKTKPAIYWPPETWRSHSYW